VRSHSKASTARSTQRSPSRTRLGVTKLMSLAAISLLALLAGATPALGAVVSDRPLLFSFDGSDTTAGAFTGVNTLDIDQASGTVYVIDQEKNVLSKFNAAGVAQSFSATGQSSMGPSFSNGFPFNFFSDVAVDNYGANAGRIHVLREFGPVKAFSPAGAALWELSGFNDICGLAVDTDGNPWIGDYTNKRAREYASSGSPPAEVGFVSTGSDQLCRLDVDASGNLYINRYGAGVDKYVGGVKGPTIDPASSKGVTVDQSSATGHVFTLHSGDFNEYDSTGALIGTFGAGAIGTAEGIAYNSSLDRVYVPDSGSDTVKVFGPAVTSTVPDTAIEATTEVGISKAKFNGKVNPQSVPNSYFFEWKQGTGSNWGAAKSSTPQSLPEDSSDHAVSFNATGLAGNTTYQVRLVGTNTATGLRAASSVDTFTTTTAAQAPAVTIAPPVPGTTTAQINGTVNPREDAGTTWRLQTSVDPACASGFTDQPLKNLNSEASVPVAVAEELTGLIPAGHYCVRIRATNSFGSTTSEVKELTTDAVPPTQVFTAFAAPRTDTTARLNGRVNPEGAPLTYRFEYSEDGGATWIARPDLENTSGVRKQIVVADELTGLSPSTTYEYRFVAENSAGGASPQGEEKSFTTRTTAEMNPPARGFELINNPDKGNQHARAEVIQETSPISPDGEKVIWSVLGGAPGGNSGAGATFLAQRTDTGWHSKSLIPPGKEQPGEGKAGGYALDATTPDLSAFIFNTGVTALERGKTMVRVNENQAQTLLAEYDRDVDGGNVDLTDDGAHALFVSPITLQLEDTGAGPPGEVVSVMPDGLQNECGLDFGSENRSFVGGGNAPEAAAKQWRPGYHMIATTDASRVYFQAKPNGGSCGSSLWGIYVRNRDASQTTLIDPGPGAGGQSPQFITTTPDGREAYFLTYSKLDPGDSNSSPDIYRWDEGAGESSCLTCFIPNANVSFNSGGSPGRVMISSDFSHIYFESTSQLVPGQGKAGEYNVYVLRGEELGFVVDANDTGGLLDDEAQLSDNGNVLLFVPPSLTVAHQELTADKLAPTCVPMDSTSSELCRELFRYDDSVGSLECLSCQWGGITTNRVGSPAAPAVNTFAMSADGSTIAFATREALLPLDVNKDADIYEWRNGVRRLISDGVTNYPVSILASPQVHGIDSDGTSILFSLVDADLTGFEEDGLANLYDARFGGGFTPPSPAVHCSEDSCQGPLETPPAKESSASVGFTGRGNLPAAQRRRCRAARVRRGKRCVSKRTLAHRACREKRGAAKRSCVRSHLRRLTGGQGQVSRSARAGHDAGRGK
jgi:hypothetical protein